MKTTINEMSREEIIALTEEQLKFLCDIECAKNGVALLGKEPIKPQYAIPPRDAKYFEIAGLFFTKQEDALIVLEAINKVGLYELAYDYGVGYDYKYLKLADSKGTEIKSGVCYSSELFNRLQKNLRDISEQEKKYEGEIKGYRDTLKKRTEATQYILDMYYNALEEVENENRLRSKFDEYLKLANGDRSMALSFLEKVESIPASLRDELVPPTEVATN